MRAPHDGFDALNELVAGIDVDARVAVRDSSVSRWIFFHVIILPAPKMGA
jgi:hypothetical protein